MRDAGSSGPQDRARRLRPALDAVEVERLASVAGRQAHRGRLRRSTGRNAFTSVSAAKPFEKAAGARLVVLPRTVLTMPGSWPAKRDRGGPVFIRDWVPTVGTSSSRRSGGARCRQPPRGGSALFQDLQDLGMPASGKRFGFFRSTTSRQGCDGFVSFAG